MARYVSSTQGYLAVLATRKAKRNHKRTVCNTFGVIKQLRKRCVSKRVDDVQEIDIEQPTDISTCDCGCSRDINRQLTLLLHQFFASKSRWLNILKIGRWRPGELERVSLAIEENGHEAMGDANLDLDTIQLDISRQQWLNDEGDAYIVKQALLTFCLVNNVGYWQGLHDVAAAFAHVEPKPSVGELAAIVEKLVSMFASIIMRATDENIVSDATRMAAKWRLIFRYFFPKVSTELERFADVDSWNINWFLTMGFYRFGCAYLALAYTYAAVVASAGCMTAFMYHEAGYLGVRGYISWRLTKNRGVESISNNLFDDQIDEQEMVKAITNSKMIQLTPDELINVSRNLYDTLNDVECEMAEFPMIAILKMSNFLFNKSPLMLYNSNDVCSKNVVQIGIADIFKSNDRQRTNGVYTRQSQVITRGPPKWAVGYRVCEKFSETMNNAMFTSYIRNLHVNVMKKSFIFPSRFAESMLKGDAIVYNIVDVRSPYLRYGEPLESLFKILNAMYLTEADLDDVIIGMNPDQTFTVWIIVTDDGFENMSDATSLESLDRGIDIYRMLSRTCTGVAILKGGYKELLRWHDFPVPTKVNTFIKRLLDWMPIGRGQGPKIAIQNVVTAIDHTFGDITERIGHDVVSKLGLFRRRSRKMLSLTVDQIVNVESKKVDCGRYKICMAIQNRSCASFDSMGGIKVNGIIWHPQILAKQQNNQLASFILYVASLFKVTNTDGLLEVVPENASARCARNVVYRGITNYGERLAGELVVLCGDVRSKCNTIMHTFMPIRMKLTPTCIQSQHGTIVKSWNLVVISGRSMISALLVDEMILRQCMHKSIGDTETDDHEYSLQADNCGNMPQYSIDQEQPGLHRYYTALDVQSLMDDNAIATEHGLVVENVVPTIDLSRVVSSTSNSGKEPSICSDRKVHVFSRRVNHQSKVIAETVVTPMSTQSKSTNAVKNVKPVFAARKHLKKAHATCNPNY
ncbi:TBC domain containing protein, putative [Babesia ovis]|uniref:TBC domain containing protein, putative n=1 Tax=Babesia ovis TaxID=5869 RepID=A0A9W5TAG1_BABOV|nr:TBC domain containing protein, putative [Babesia ovis]